MTMPMINECHSPSFKSKLKSTISCFTCRSDDVERLGGGGGNRRSHHTSPRSHCSWLAQDLDIKDKCLGLIGKRGKNTRRRYNSADFRYDIASYTLNFDDEIHREDDDNEMPLHNFSSRLPATPDRPSVVVVGVRQARDEMNPWL
ncbi:hypothetical protein M5689_011918 [Euphorbia peplus]|nr:hypothetical protein M5689_011918 [Euphorbia peplus]